MTLPDMSTASKYLYFECLVLRLSCSLTAEGSIHVVPMLRLATRLCTLNELKLALKPSRFDDVGVILRPCSLREHFHYRALLPSTTTQRVT